MGSPGAPGDPDAGRRLRAEGACGRGPRRRRRDHPARRSADHPVDHGHCRKSAAEAGRDPAQLKCIVCAPSHITDDIAEAREQVRWFPAMVSNHVMDLIERYGYDSAIPEALTEYVGVRKFYDYDEHSRVGAKHGEFVTDEICDRFCVLGTAEQATAKLKELESIGVDQFNIYLMTHGQEEVLRRTATRSSRSSRRARHEGRGDDARRPARRAGRPPTGAPRRGGPGGGRMSGTSRATSPSGSSAPRSTAGRDDPRARRRAGRHRLHRRCPPRPTRPADLDRRRAGDGRRRRGTRVASSA